MKFTEFICECGVAVLAPQEILLLPQCPVCHNFMREATTFEIALRRLSDVCQLLKKTEWIHAKVVAFLVSLSIAQHEMMHPHFVVATVRSALPAFAERVRVCQDTNPIADTH